MLCAAAAVYTESETGAIDGASSHGTGRIYLLGKLLRKLKPYV